MPGRIYVARPNFHLLAGKGYRIYTIYHVNVVDYFAAIYLHGWAQPETLTSLHRFIEHSPLRHVIPRAIEQFGAWSGCCRLGESCRLYRLGEA